jgi:hypothetical protein
MTWGWRRHYGLAMILTRWQNWLYGAWLSRNYVIDIDTALELAAHVTTARPLATTEWVLQDSAGMRRLADDLENMSAWNRSQLILLVHDQISVAGLDQASEWEIRFTRDQNGWIGVPQDDDQRLQRELTEELAGNGRPRFIRHPIGAKALRYFLPAMIGAAVWVWIEVTLRMPIAVNVAGWVFVALVFWLSYPRYFTARARIAVTIPQNRGHRIRDESREKTRLRRADARANLRAALITAVVLLPVSVGGTLLVTWLTGSLHL